MPAHSDTTGRAGFAGFQGTNQIVKQTNSGVSSVGDAVDKVVKNAKKGVKNFNKWLEKLFDWVEVRLDRIQRRIDLNSAETENLIGSSKKNKNINKAMDAIAKNVSQFDSVQLVTGKNGQVTKYTGNPATNTLFGDSVRGALKYQQQANAVSKQALKNGVFKSKSRNTPAKQKAYRDNIINKIQNGDINISEYSGDVRKFIDAYKEWYDKSQDLVQSTAELKQQYNELQQTKLDNITEEFETLVGLSEAVKASSEATVDYYTTVGKAVNTADRKEIVGVQQKRQAEITETLKNEISAYKGELKNAEKVFGTNSNEYREAKTKLEEMNKSLIESQKAEKELIRATYDLENTVRGYVIERIKTLVDKLGAIASLAEKRGTRNYSYQNGDGTTVSGTYKPSEDPYIGQIKYNNELVLKYYDDIDKKKAEIKDLGYEVNSEKYQELYKQITDDESAIYSLLSANEDLRDSIRNMRWKGYEELQDNLDDVKSDLEHISSFIRDGEILDDDGQFTERGYARIAIIGEEMDLAQQKIRNAREALSKLDDEVRDGTISQEKYNEEVKAQIGIIQDSASAMFDYQQKLADMYIDQITAENDALQDLISARKDALSAKKEYYDYDKTLKSKNKDIAQLQAQINALNGVTNDAAVAKRAKLQAELSEKQEDLQDTLYQHSIDLQQEGYDKLSEDMQKSLDDTVKLINGDQKVLNEVAGQMLDLLRANGVDEGEILAQIRDENATRLSSSTDAIIETLSGENGVSTLLSDIGVKQDDVANAITSLDITGAIDARQPDASVSGIDTNISITKDSLDNDIAPVLHDIEEKLGEFNKDGKLESEVTDGDDAKGNSNVAGDVTNTDKLTTKDNVPADEKRVVEQPPTGQQQQKKQPVKKSDPILDLINSGKARSKKITAKEKKEHGDLWEYVAKKYGRSLTNAQIGKLAGLLGVKVANKSKPTSAEKTKILNKLNKKNYAKGTKRVDDDLFAWTNENADKIGPELIVRPSDGAILTPLKANDSVIPANLADNLFKWGAISPDKFITNPFVGKWSAEGGGSVTNNADYTAAPQTVEMHFDSLFHIEGNVDESVMPRLENLGKSLVNDRDFQKNVIKFVTKDFVRESKKQGIR